MENKRLNGHRDKVLFVAFSPDGQTLASASADLRSSGKVDHENWF